MKTKAVYYIAAGLALALTVSVCDGLRTRDKYSVLTGRLEEAIAQERLNVAEKDRVISEKVKVIAALDKKIATSEQAISGLKGSIASKDKDLAALRESWAGFSLECQASLRALDTKWAEKFTLLESVVAQKDAQLADWASKFAAQVTISDAWKAKYEDSQRLLALSLDVNKSLVRKVKAQAIIGNLKAGAIVAAAGWVIFNAIKGT